jgi:hypothetical protein
MQCDNCKKKDDWLEIVGENFICKKCISKHRELGYILNTKKDTFEYIIKKTKVKNFEEMLKITRDQIDDVVDLKEQGITIPLTKEEKENKREQK